MKIESARKFVWLTGRNSLELQSCQLTREDGLYPLNGYVVYGSTEGPVFLAEDPLVLCRGVQMFYEFWDSEAEYTQHCKLQEMFSRWRKEEEASTMSLICNVLVKYKIDIENA